MRKVIFLGLDAHKVRCLLYTSDAADERSSVDLGGRRIIKKKRRKNDEVQTIAKLQENKHRSSMTRRPEHIDKKNEYN